MGINNLNKFLKKHCPEVYGQVSLKEYSGMKIAIDISIYVCKYKMIYHSKWLGAFINLISCLRKNNIHCTMIYDTGAPPEKDAERKIRSDRRFRHRQKVLEYEAAIEKYKATGDPPECLKILYQTKAKKRLLCNPEVDMKIVEDLVHKMRRQILTITQKDFDLTRQLFDILHVPWIDADLEAETLCANLCRDGKVDAVLSEDTDLLAYGTPTFLSKINTVAETVTVIRYQDVLDKLEVTEEQFLDFCIMCGTDYNKNIFRIGPDKSWKYIMEHGDIDTIDKETKLDVSILNHVRTRELFKNSPTTGVSVSFCGKPNFPDLYHFCRVNHIFLDTETLKKYFNNPPLNK